MDELKKDTTAEASETATPTAAAEGTGTVNTTASFRAYPNDTSQADAINQMYDSQIASKRTALEESGAQALSDAQANRDKIADTYQKQRNASAVNFERQRRNFLEGANTSGVNTGANSQYQLSMMGQQNRTQTNLGAQQAQAETAADRNIADIKRSTQASINEAVANNDYQRAAALLDEYNNAYARAVDRADKLAAFGDFSGYADVYGDEAATQAFYNWAAQNTDLAYMMGLIDDDQRKNLKAKKAIDYVRPASSSSGGGGGSSGSSSGGDWAAQQREQLEQGTRSGSISEEAARSFANYYGL